MKDISNVIYRINVTCVLLFTFYKLNGFIMHNYQYRVADKNAYVNAKLLK